MEQALELVERASYLQGAIRRKDTAGVAQAALLMGSSVAGIRNEAVLSGGTGGEQGSRSKLSEQLYRAARAEMVKFYRTQ